VPSPSDPQSLNRYSYVRNSPLNRIDPSGHVDCDKNQWGDTCESSTAEEKDDADANNALCAYDPAACQPDLSPRANLERVVFFFGGMALSVYAGTAEVMYSGYVGVAGNMAGTATSNVLQGKPFSEGVLDPLDNTLAFIGGKLTAGRGAIFTGIVVMGQSAAKQAINNKKIDPLEAGANGIIGGLGSALANPFSKLIKGVGGSLASKNAAALSPAYAQFGAGVVDNLIAPTASDTIVKSGFAWASNVVQNTYSMLRDAIYGINVWRSIFPND
jgi:hypothetical protein